MKDPHVYAPKTPKTLNKRFRPSHKQVFWAMTIFAVLILVIAGYVVVSTKMRYDDAATKIEQAIDAANKNLEGGDIKAAKSQMKAVENLQARNSDKAHVYAVLASIATMENQSGDVINYYEKKHKLDPSSAKSDALDLGSYYQRIGENQKALEQYRIAVEYLESQPAGIGRNMDLSAAKARIEEIGAQQ